MTPEEKIEALREWLGNRHSSCRCMICIELLDPIRDIIDPPRAKWRQEVDDWVAEVPYPLGSTLRELADLEYGAEPTTVRLARIVAICEQEVGDGWRANPDRVPVGHWGISWLLVTLSHEPPAWRVLGDRAAAWLRSLTDGGAA